MGQAGQGNVAFVIVWDASNGSLAKASIASVKAAWPECRIYAILLKNTDFAADLLSDVLVTRLPLGSEDSRLAEGVGLQLAFNENADCAFVLAGDRSTDDREIAESVSALTLGKADVVLDDAQGQSAVRLGLSRRAAYVALLWAQMPELQRIRRYEILTWILRSLGTPAVTPSGRKSLPPPGSPPAISEPDAIEFFRSTGLLLRPVSEPPARKAKSVAVITPYYKEETWKLRRCHDAVLRQGENVRHFLIADGHPNREVASWDASHVVLASAHADKGGTPRGIGGMLAFAQGYDAVALLDADNWFADNHVRSLIETQNRLEASTVCAMRNIVLPDGTQLEQMDAGDQRKRHVDTSSYLFTRERRFLASFYAQLPQFCGPISDRFVFAVARDHQGLAWTDERTVYYESNYALHYKKAGKAVPAEVNAVSDDLQKKSMQPDLAMIAEFRQRTGRPWPFETLTPIRDT